MWKGEPEGREIFTLLQYASKGDLEGLKQLKQTGANMDLEDYDGRRAIHLAAADGHLECCRFLLEECEVAHSPRDRWKHTPIDEAKQENVKRYLKDFVTKALEQEKGEIIYSLLSGAAQGDMAMIRRLHHDGKDMRMADYDGRTALHLASSEGRLDVVRYLLETCKVNHSPKDRWYHTPLDEARTFKKDSVVRYLEEYISKAPLDNSKGAQIFSLLNMATKGDVNGMFKLNQERFEMGISDYDGRTALHLAASEGHLECVKYLVEKCNVSINPKDRWNHTPLDEARRFKQDSIARFLEKAQMMQSKAK